MGSSLEGACQDLLNSCRLAGSLSSRDTNPPSTLYRRRIYTAAGHSGKFAGGGHGSLWRSTGGLVGSPSVAGGIFATVDAEKDFEGGLPDLLKGYASVVAKNVEA